MNKIPEYLDKKNYLPTTVDEVKALGWDRPDIIIFTGDAYVDHPSFGAAVIGRTLQAAGFKVALVPQPNWRDDLRDFKKLGAPRLFFGVSAGAMDSMVNHYTANRRIRHDDAYTPGGKHGMRPDYPTIVYSKILKELYPEIPVIAGGIEASMRRLAHYDYWKDTLRPSILMDSKVDLLSYGMGEKTIVEIARRLNDGENIKNLVDIPQTALLTDDSPGAEDIILNSFEKCLSSKKSQVENFKRIEEESNKWQGKTIWQKTGNRWVRVNPMYPPMEIGGIDASFDLPYTRMPHPRYKGKTIPAYEMIKHSVTMHRGCFGGCSFCTISAHQGKFVSSRSKESILKEVRKISEMPDFKGYISDLGGPSANMYAMGGKNIDVCKKCKRPSCLHPSKCPNLDNNHAALLEIYEKVKEEKGIKKAFVGSGVRYDLIMADNNDATKRINDKYLEELVAHHVSGRLKVAPEHTSDKVLDLMRKPSFSQFYDLKEKFDKINRKYGLNQQLIPYFISSHPGCAKEDMAELAAETKQLDFKLEQVQDFTPTPMTLSTEMFYTGINPYTGKNIYVARGEKDKLAQRQYFFWYKPDFRESLLKDLRSMHRPDLVAKLFSLNPKIKKGCKNRKG